MRRFVSIAIVTSVISVTSVQAADRQHIRMLNVTLQPVFTVLSAALQGHLRTKEDWIRCVTSGAGSGYVFYDAKARAARGAVAAAWLEANAAASLSANAADGRLLRLAGYVAS